MLPADDARRAYVLLHRTAASELDPIWEIHLGVSLRALSRASSVALELVIIAGRPLALRALLTKILAGALASLEHPAGRNLETGTFASFDLL